MQTVAELRATLGQAMKDVSSGSISTEQARQIAGLGSVVCDTVRLEIELARATDGDYKGSGFIDVDPTPARRSLSRP